MTDWIQFAHERRCEGKRAYRTAELADEAAEKASKKLGALILSYECCDCGLWHIGHADSSQEKAHRPVEQLFCVACGEFISKRRHTQLVQGKVTVWTCGPRCTKRNSRRGRQSRRNAPIPRESGFS